MSRPQRLKALDEAVRKVGALSVLISDLVAARVGLNSTDLECLDLLLLSGSTTAGRVAIHSGLTTGATTAVIDRLEAAGFVRRRRDGRDRRVVLIDVVPERTALIEPFYAPLAKACADVHRRYSDRQLATFEDYLGRAIDASAAHVAWLQTQPPTVRARRRHLSPGPPSGGKSAARAGRGPRSPGAPLAAGRVAPGRKPIGRKAPGGEK